MAKMFSVNVPEIWTRTFNIVAENEEQAKVKVNELLEEGQEGDIFEYSSTSDVDSWDALEIETEQDKAA